MVPCTRLQYHAVRLSARAEADAADALPQTRRAPLRAGGVSRCSSAGDRAHRDRVQSLWARGRGEPGLAVNSPSRVAINKKSLSTFQQMWISKQEYDECGPSIVHRKCF